MRLILDRLAELDATLHRNVEQARSAQRDITPDGRRAAGDEAALRGIPVVGVRGGKGGAIPGTRPGDCGRAAAADEEFIARRKFPGQRTRRPRAQSVRRPE